MTKVNSRLERKVKGQFALLGVFLLLLVFYLAQTNGGAEQTFARRKLESTGHDLQEEIRRLTLDISAARSLAAINDKAVSLHLATPLEVSFVPVGFDTVALSNNDQERPSASESE